MFLTEQGYSYEIRDEREVLSRAHRRDLTPEEPAA